MGILEAIRKLEEEQGRLASHPLIHGNNDFRDGFEQAIQYLRKLAGLDCRYWPESTPGSSG